MSVQENVFGLVFRKGRGELCWLFQWIETIASRAVLPAQYLLDLSWSSVHFSLNMADSLQMFDAMPIWDRPPTEMSTSQHPKIHQNIKYRTQQSCGLAAVSHRSSLSASVTDSDRQNLEPTQGMWRENESLINCRRIWKGRKRSTTLAEIA